MKKSKQKKISKFLVGVLAIAGLNLGMQPRAEAGWLGDKWKQVKAGAESGWDKFKESTDKKIEYAKQHKVETMLDLSILGPSLAANKKLVKALNELSGKEDPKEPHVLEPPILTEAKKIVDAAARVTAHPNPVEKGTEIVTQNVLNKGADTAKTLAEMAILHKLGGGSGGSGGKGEPAPPGQSQTTSSQAPTRPSSSTPTGQKPGTGTNGGSPNPAPDSGPMSDRPTIPNMKAPAPYPGDMQAIPPGGSRTPQATQYDFPLPTSKDVLNTRLFKDPAPGPKPGPGTPSGPTNGGPSNPSPSPGPIDLSKRLPLNPNDPAVQEMMKVREALKQSNPNTSGSPSPSPDLGRRIYPNSPEAKEVAKALRDAGIVNGGGKGGSSGSPSPSPDLGRRIYPNSPEAKEVAKALRDAGIEKGNSGSSKPGSANDKGGDAPAVPTPDTKTQPLPSPSGNPLPSPGGKTAGSGPVGTTRTEIGPNGEPITTKTYEWEWKNNDGSTTKTTIVAVETTDANGQKNFRTTERQITTDANGLMSTVITTTDETRYADGSREMTETTTDANGREKTTETHTDERGNETTVETTEDTTPDDTADTDDGKETSKEGTKSADQEAPRSGRTVLPDSANYGLHDGVGDGGNGGVRPNYISEDGGVVPPRPTMVGPTMVEALPEDTDNPKHPGPATVSDENAVQSGPTNNTPIGVIVGPRPNWKDGE